MDDKPPPLPPHGRKVQRTTEQGDQQVIDQQIGTSQQTAALLPMAPTSDTYSYPKLGDSNFQSWKIAITTLLKIKGLYETVQGTGRADPMDELRAKMFIFQSLEEKYMFQVRACTSAKEMMERLSLIHADASKENLSRMLRKFYGYKLVQSDGMSMHIGKMEAMRMELADLGQGPTDEVFINQLLESLPHNYSSLKEIWDATEDKRKTVGELITRILKREQDLKAEVHDSHLESALLSRGKLTIEERKKVTKCAKCGKKGHWARECTAKPRRGTFQENREVAL